MPTALLKYTNNMPAQSVITLVEGNVLRLKLEGVSKIWRMADFCLDGAALAPA
jgi:hypothetical protein